MANYHSIIRNWGEPESTFDTELAMGALEYKQGKYDANSAKIQEAISNYGNIGLLRDKEKQKLYGNLSQMMENIEGASGLDLSSNRVTGMIMSDISKTIDEDLVKHYSLFKNKASYDEVASKKQAEGKGKYSEENYQYALEQSGYNAYMRGEDGADSFGPLSYTDYEDLGEASQRIGKDVKSYIETIKTKEIQGEIFYVTKESKELTRQRIIDIADATLTEGERKQMTINSWAKYQNLGTEQLTEDYGKLAITNIAHLNRAITELKSRKSKVTGEQALILDDEISKYEERVIEDTKSYNEILQGGEEGIMQYSLGKTEFDNRITRAFSIDRDKLTVEEITYVSNSIANIKAGQEEGEDTRTGTNVVTRPMGEDERDIYTEKRELVANTENEYLATILDVYSHLDNPEVKSTIDDLAEEAFSEIENPSQNDIDKFKAEKLIELTEEGNFSSIVIEDVKRVEQAKIKYERAFNDFEDKRKAVMSEFYDQSYSEIFKEGVDVSNFQVLIGDQVVNLEQEFAKREIFTKEDLLRDTPEKDNQDLRAAISVEVELTEDSPTNIRVREFFREIGALVNLQTINAGYGHERIKIEIEKSKEAKESLESLKDIYINEGGLGEQEAEAEAIKALSNGATGVSEIKAKESSERPIGIFGSGQSTTTLDDSNYINIRALSRKRDKNSYKKAMRTAFQEEQDPLTRSVGVVFDDRSPAYRDLISVVKSPLYGEIFIPKKGAEVTITEMPNGEMEVSSVKTTKDGDVPIVKRFLQADLPESVRDLVNIEGDNKVFTSKTFPEDTKGVARYTDDVETVGSVAYSFYGDDKEAAQLEMGPEVKTRLLELSKTNEAGVNEKGETMKIENLYSRTRAVVSQVIDNEEKPLLVGVKKTSDRYRGNQVYAQAYLEIGGKRHPVFTDTLPQSEGTMDKFWETVRYHPQKITNAFLKRMATGNISERDLIKLENYYNIQNQ